MSRARPVYPGSFYQITRRCSQRQFLLRPDAETNENFVYCLAEAAERFDMDVILPATESNHHHTTLYDRHGHINEFLGHFHRDIAKCQNVTRRRSENMWSSAPPCVVRLVDPQDVIDKLVYAATNPVKDRLVERVRHWPGVNGLFALLNQRTITARRPRYFRKDGSMPESVTLQLKIPPELGDPEEIRRVLRERVAEFEEAMAKKRAHDGTRVLGRRAILRQSWQETPTTSAPRSRLRPRIAAGNVEARVEALRRNRAFLAAYAEARTTWLEGGTAIFPFGTYWLRRFAGVPVAPLN